MRLSANIRQKSFRLLDRYGIVLAGILIFGYYLWAALDLFSSSNPRRGFQGYFFQFSSVVLLWGLLFVGAKLYDYKKKQREEHESHRKIALEFERQKMQVDLLDEVTTLMSDAINNPLAVISLSASSIRRRFESDDEVVSFLDRIDGALKRMREVLAEFHSYQTKRIIKSSQGLQSHAQSALAVDSKGEVRHS